MIKVRTFWPPRLAVGNRARLGTTRHAWQRYALGLLLVSAAWLLTELLLPWVQPRVTPLFFLATILSARYGGLGPGLLASAVSTLVLVYLYIPPLYTFTFVEVSEVAQAVVFLVTTSIVSTLSAQRRTALAAAESAHADAVATAKRMARLQQITAALSAARAPSEVFGAILEEGTPVLDWRAAYILLVTEDGRALRLVRALGYPAHTFPEALEQPLSANSPAAQVARTGQPLWVQSQTEFATQSPQLAPLRAGAGNEATAYVPLALGQVVVGTLVIGFREARHFSDDERDFLLTLGRLLAQALERGHLYEREQHARQDLEMQVQRATAELRAANTALQREMAERLGAQQRLERSREEERARIARELHDELGGDLTGLIFSVSWLLARPDVSPEAREQLNNLSDDIEATLWSVRRLATELHPLIIQKLGLLGALEWQFNEFLARTELDGEFESAVDELPLAEEAATSCFRIFQEALTNIARHAQATRVEARVASVAGRLVLTVSDNGTGLPDQPNGSAPGLGITSMRERAALLEAELSLFSQPQRGTRISLKLPELRADLSADTGDTA